MVAGLKCGSAVDVTSQLSCYMTLESTSSGGRVRMRSPEGPRLLSSQVAMAKAAGHGEIKQET